MIISRSNMHFMIISRLNMNFVIKPRSSNQDQTKIISRSNMHFMIKPRSNQDYFMTKYAFQDQTYYIAYPGFGYDE